MSAELIIDYNNPLVGPFKISSVSNYAFLTDIEERTNFFTTNLRKRYVNLDLCALNEQAYEEIAQKYNIYEGFNVKDSKNLNSTELDDVYLHISNLDYSDNQQNARPVFLLKTNLYTGKTSFIILTADFDISELSPDELIDPQEPIEFKGSEDDLYEFIRYRAIDRLKNDPSYIWLEGLEVAKVNTRYLFEGIIDDKSKNEFIKILFQNTSPETLMTLKLPKVNSFEEYLNALRDSAIEDLQFGYLYRLFERNHVDFSYIIDRLKQCMEKEKFIKNKEEIDFMSKNKLVLSRDEDNRYLVNGTYVGTFKELAADIEAMNKLTQCPNLIAEINNNGQDCTVMKYDNYYEIGIELPMDFAKINNIDEEKICSLLQIDGFPIAVDPCVSAEYGNLAGKPAVFVVSGIYDQQKVIEFANICSQKVSTFDFADYCITHNGYDALTKDDAELLPDYMQTETFNIATDSFETPDVER